MTSGPAEEPKSVAEEIATLQKDFPKVQIITATTSFVKAEYQRTPYARIKIILTFPSPSEEYPATKPLIVDVQKHPQLVPPGLKRKLDKDFGSIAVQRIGTFTQVSAVLSALVEFVDTNLFVPCWKEVKQTVEFVQQQQQQNEQVSMDATKGLIQIKFQASQYFLKCSMRIDPSYPITSQIENYGKPCKVTAIANGTNLPIAVSKHLIKYTQQFIRCRQDGMDDSFAAGTTASFPITIPKELLSEEEQVQMELQYKANITEYDGRHPQPSLLSGVKFLYQQLSNLTEVQCPVCNQNVFPQDPKELTKLYSDGTGKTAKSKQQQHHLRPICSACTCWYHSGCMQQVIREPPFGKTCSNPKCKSQGRCRVYHPDIWPKNVSSFQQLESMYYTQQTKQREIDEVADFF